MQTLKKRSRFVFVAIMIFSLIAMYGYVPMVEAANLTSVSDLISDSDLGSVSVTHTITFTTGATLSQDQYMQVIIPSDFSTVATTSVTCADSASTTAYVFGGGAQDWDVRCIADEAIATGSKTIVIAGTENPSTQGAYSIGVNTKTSGDVVIEDATTKVYILSSVSVSATVNAILSFSIATTTPDDSLNGHSFTGTSSPTSIAFGEIDDSQAYLMGHVLSVSTNANDGYKVTIEQDQDLQTAAGATIDPYSTSSPSAWDAPTGDYTDETTWGHWGVTSDDTDDFTADTYQGLDGTTPLTVMEHNGPANGATVGVGTTTVAYELQISALQQAGDYQNTITYICTPTF